MGRDLLAAFSGLLTRPFCEGLLVRLALNTRKVARYLLNKTRVPLILGPRPHAAWLLDLVVVLQALPLLRRHLLRRVLGQSHRSIGPVATRQPGHHPESYPRKALRATWRPRRPDVHDEVFHDILGLHLLQLRHLQGLWVEAQVPPHPTERLRPPLAQLPVREHQQPVAESREGVEHRSVLASQPWHSREPTGLSPTACPEHRRVHAGLLEVSGDPSRARGAQGASALPHLLPHRRTDPLLFQGPKLLSS